jgi:hypothetical protein
LGERGSVLLQKLTEGAVVLRGYAIVATAVALTAARAAAVDFGSGGVDANMFPTAYELKWDNGTLGYVRTHILAGTWVGNDFDTSSLAARNVKYLKFYSSGQWPNGAWDGFNIGLYRFAGGLPGNLIWGPVFVRGSGTGYRWCSFDVGWPLPKGISTFVAAVEQAYDYPNADPYCLDTSPASGRAWTYYRGIWRSLETYTNLMLRVVMWGDIGVEPTSIGRVKALYY